MPRRTSPSPRPSSRAQDRHAPRKQLGQHFLRDRNILNKVIKAAEPGPGQVVLEIGPGLGDMTRVLAETGAHIVAVELDSDLTVQLIQEFSAVPHVHILEGNVLDRPPQEWLALGQ